MAKKSLYQLLEEWIVGAVEDLQARKLDDVKVDLKIAIKILERIEQTGASFEYVEIID